MEKSLNKSKISMQDESFISEDENLASTIKMIPNFDTRKFNSKKNEFNIMNIEEEIGDKKGNKLFHKMFKINKLFPEENLSNVKTKNTTLTHSNSKNIEKIQACDEDQKSNNIMLMNPFYDGNFEMSNNEPKNDEDVNFNANFDLGENHKKINEPKNNAELLKKKRKLPNNEKNNEINLERIYEEIKRLFYEYNTKYSYFYENKYLFNDKKFDLIPSYAIFEQQNDSFEKVATIIEEKIPGCCIYFNKYLISKIYLIREEEFLIDKKDILKIFEKIKNNILNKINKIQNNI
jgi:hypothetical protein